MPINPANLLQLQVMILGPTGEQLVAAVGQADASAPLVDLQQQLSDLAGSAFDEYSALLAA